VVNKAASWRAETRGTAVKIRSRFTSRISYASLPLKIRDLVSPHSKPWRKVPRRWHGQVISIGTTKGDLLVVVAVLAVDVLFLLIVDEVAARAVSAVSGDPELLTELGLVLVVSHHVLGNVHVTILHPQFISAVGKLAKISIQTSALLLVVSADLGLEPRVVGGILLLLLVVVVQPVGSDHEQLGGQLMGQLQVQLLAVHIPEVGVGSGLAGARPGGRKSQGLFIPRNWVAGTTGRSGLVIPRVWVAVNGRSELAFFIPRAEVAVTAGAPVVERVTTREVKCHGEHRHFGVLD